MAITQPESEVVEIQGSRENGYIRNEGQDEQPIELLNHYEDLSMHGKLYIY